MKNTKTNLAVAICCLGSLAAANVGRAALTTISLVANNGVSGLTMTTYDTAHTPNTMVDTWAGSWTAKITGGYVPDGAPALNTAWQTFCVDINNGMPATTTQNYTALAFAAGDPPANNPPDPKWVAGGGSKAGYLYNLYNSSATTSVLRSALAISIWEVLYESDAYNFSSHNATKGFQVAGSGTASTGLGIGSEANQAIWQATQWLTAAVTDGFNNAPTTTWWREETNDAQSLIGSPTAVPEPGTYMAGLLLLLPFAASTIRRRSKVS